MWVFRTFSWSSWILVIVVILNVVNGVTKEGPEEVGLTSASHLLPVSLEATEAHLEAIPEDGFNSSGGWKWPSEAFEINDTVSSSDLQDHGFITSAESIDDQALDTRNEPLLDHDWARKLENKSEASPPQVVTSSEPLENSLLNDANEMAAVELLKLQPYTIPASDGPRLLEIIPQMVNVTTENVFISAEEDTEDGGRGSNVASANIGNDQTYADTPQALMFKSQAAGQFPEEYEEESVLPFSSSNNRNYDSNSNNNLQYFSNASTNGYFEDYSSPRPRFSSKIRFHNNISSALNDVVNDNNNNDDELVVGSWGHKTNKGLNDQITWSRRQPELQGAELNETGTGGDPIIIDQTVQEPETPEKQISEPSQSEDDDEESSGKTLMMRRRPRRSVVHLYDMVVCATGCNPLMYKGYGCFCGFMGSGLTVDGIDKCCFKHDWCYHHAKCPPLLTYFVPYYWTCNAGRPKCISDYRSWQGICGAHLCECDRQFAECLKKYPCPRSRAMCMTSPWRFWQNIMMPSHYSNNNHY